MTSEYLNEKYYEGYTFFKEVSRTKGDAASIYKGYPIYEKYIMRNKVPVPLQGTGKFWRPFFPLSGSEYIPYTANAEYLTQTPPLTDEQMSYITEDGRKRQRGCPPIEDTTTKGYKRIFKNDFYTHTGAYVPVSVILNEVYGSAFNPYTGNSISIYVKDATTLNALSSMESGQTYWWDRCGERMLAIPRLPVSQLAHPSQLMAVSIREGRILARMATGMTRLAATEEVDNIDKIIPTPGGGGAGGGGKAEDGTGTTASDKTKAKASIRTTLKVRGNFGYVGVGARAGNEPQMVQMYQQPNKTSPEVARHIFNPVPSQISYSNIGSDWQDIERAGQIPLVDWKSYKLMTVSFQFLVVPVNQYRLGAFSESPTENTINLSIDDDLRNLRAMATRPFPVILYGFDDMLNTQLRYPESDKPRGVEFVIADMNMSAIHRTVNGEINRATIDITLREVPLEAISLIEMPKLTPLKVNPPPPDFPPDYGKRRLFTDDSNVILD